MPRIPASDTKVLNYFLYKPRYTILWIWQDITVSVRTSLDLLFANTDHVLKCECSNCWKSIADPKVWKKSRLTCLCNTLLQFTTVPFYFTHLTSECIMLWSYKIQFYITWYSIAKYWIKHCIEMAQHRLEYQSTIDTPWFACGGEIWGSYCGYFKRKFTMLC